MSSIIRTNTLQTSCNTFIKRKGKEKCGNFLQDIQFINDISDVLHISSGYNSGLRNFN